MVFSSFDFVIILTKVKQGVRRFNLCNNSPIAILRWISRSRNPGSRNISPLHIPWATFYASEDKFMKCFLNQKIMPQEMIIILLNLIFEPIFQILRTFNCFWKIVFLWLTGFEYRCRAVDMLQALDDSEKNLIISFFQSKIIVQT